MTAVAPADRTRAFVGMHEQAGGSLGPERSEVRVRVNEGHRR